MAFAQRTEANTYQNRSRSEKWLVFDLRTKAWSVGAQTEGIQVLMKEHSLSKLGDPTRERTTRKLNDFTTKFFAHA
jgi:hypothetical protein